MFVGRVCEFLAVVHPVAVGKNRRTLEVFVPCVHCLSIYRVPAAIGVLFGEICLRNGVEFRSIDAIRKRKPMWRNGIRNGLKIAVLVIIKTDQIGSDLRA